VKKLLVLIIFSVCVTTGCNEYPAAETALEGGREFIDACLKGDFEKASFYMITDNENTKYLLKIKRDYHAKSADEKYQFSRASINVLEDVLLNDTTHIINYKNSYDNATRKVKVIKRHNAWLVDFKYTFSGNL
jgi:hypothetical protein